MTNITLVTAIRPRRLSKAFQLEDGVLVKKNGGVLVEGTIEGATVANLRDLSVILTRLTPAQALVHGVSNLPATRLMTRKSFAEAGAPAGATARTNDTFGWATGLGVLMIDYDPSAAGTALTRDALVAALMAAAPGLAGAGMLWWPSASSCIWAGETELRGIKGQRLYLLVAEASDIPRAGKALVQRLWLAGHGQIEVSKSGSKLERTLVDASVWQASRLDFAGGAYCGPGLSQRRGEPFLINPEAPPVNTLTAIPDLTAAEAEAYTVRLGEAKAEAEPDAQVARDEWVDNCVKEMLAPGKADDPDERERVTAIARRALEAGVLSGDFTIQVEMNGAFKPVAVATLLDNPNRWHGALTLDPLEPDYDGGRAVGRLFLLQARPTLHSFAHGGRTYKMHRASARVELVKGHTAEAATATIDLLRRDPVAFDFGGQLAIADSGRVHPLCEHALAFHLGHVIQFWRLVPLGDVMVPADCDPPPALLKQIITQGERRRLKPLDGVITGPTIRLDGSVLGVPGYDVGTRLLFDPLGEGVPDVPVRPTLEQAGAALELLLQPFQTFPFVDATSKGALLAAILTAAVRPVLPTSPAFAFDAPIQGSGKTLLAACVGALIEGRSPDIWPHTQGRDDEETRKRLFTALRTGCRALVWDNVTGVFDSASMAAFITAEAMVDRVLGKSESIRVPNRALLVVTGNNVALAGDLPRRFIICRIDPQTDQPFARQFDLDPLQWVLEHRAEMLAAACTLIRARFTHMTAAAPGRLASFEAWDDLVRQTVCWADRALRPGAFGDPMDLVREAQAADPESDALFSLLDALRDQFGTYEFTAKDVQVQAKACIPQGPLELALLDLAGDRALSSSRTLGRVLKFREGRIVHGLRLTGRLDTTSGARTYRVRTAESEVSGDNGYNGFYSSHTETDRQPRPLSEQPEINQLNPLNPADDVLDPEAWR